MDFLKKEKSQEEKKKERGQEKAEFSISVLMTEGCLIGKKIRICGITESITILEFVQILVSKLGFSFLIGSLCSELFGRSDFVFKEGKCTVLSNGDKNVVNATFNGSTNLTCVIKETDMGVDDGECFHIFVKTLCHKTITLCVRRFDSIELVRQRIEDNQGTLADLNYSLMFNSKSLQNCRTLADYSIQKDATLHIMFGLAGGGGEVPKGGDIHTWRFIDVTSDETVDMRVSASAPMWRRVCNGLSIEGVCKNSECDAHKERVVSCQGYVNYDLEKGLAQCPMCKEGIEPIRPIFYNCVVMYNLMKKDGSRFTTPLKRFSGPISYNEKEGEMCEYRYLIIQVRKPEAQIKDPQTQTDTIASRLCHICQRKLEKDMVAFPGKCGHMYHEGCVDTWTKIDCTCPKCSLPFAGY